MEYQSAAVHEGRLRGLREGGVATFHGVPYGASSAGANRFRAPQHAEHWAGERDATRPRASAPQLPSPFAGIFGDPSPASIDEDCLHMSIWTPGTDSDSLPVIVWVHGGSFLTGSPYLPRYDGAEFARENNVVVVLMGYRLGILGFPHFSSDTPDSAPLLNAGAWDVLHGLRWIHRNIGAFGGDRTRVCAIGQSAGAQILSHLLALEETAHYVHAAILQSAPFGLTPLSVGETRSYEARLADMQTLPVPDLLSLQSDLVRQATEAGELAPPVRMSVDGVLVSDTPLPLPPSTIPVLVTATADEASLWFDPRATTLDPAGAARDRPSRASAEFTSSTFTRPALEYLGQFHSGAAPGYFLRFDLRTRGALRGMGAPHCIDIPFVLGNARSRFAPLLQEWTEEELAHTRTLIRDIWAGFAASGRLQLRPFPDRNVITASGLSGQA